MSDKGKLKSLLERIESQAEKEIKEIEKSAEEKKEKLREEFEEEKEKISVREKENFNKQGELEKTRLISSARLQARRKILSGKRKSVEKVFDHAIDTLHELPREEARKAAENLLERMVSTGKEKIIPSEKFDIFSQSFIKKINSGRGWELKLSKPRKNLEGWFILEGENYGVTVDRAALRDFLKENWEGRVVEMLFSKKR